MVCYIMGGDCFAKYVVLSFFWGGLIHAAVFSLAYAFQWRKLKRCLHRRQDRFAPGSMLEGRMLPLLLYSRARLHSSLHRYYQARPAAYTEAGSKKS